MKLNNLTIAPKLGILIGVTLVGLCVAGGLAYQLMQQELLERAKAMRAKRTRIIDSLADYEKFFNEGGGFAWVHWAGSAEQEEELSKRCETSIRCLPFPEEIPEAARGEGRCLLTGQPSAQRVVMAKAY